MATLERSVERNVVDSEGMTSRKQAATVEGIVCLEVEDDGLCWQTKMVG